VAALEAFSEPTILIAGGKAKGTEFAVLGQAADKHAKLVILIGEAAAEIAAAIHQVKTLRAASLEEAVSLAYENADPGDVVLLSPGCASFDMFTSAEQRGERFGTAARALEAVAR
jgi:UDP-N-acetylmuramoylalanine--D-glutamate ligase